MSRKGENIRKRADGRWEGRYPAWDGERCRRISKSVYAKTYAGVKEKLAAAKILQMQENTPEKQSDAYPMTECISMASAASEWLAQVREQKKYSTYIKYRNIYENHIRDAFSGSTTADVSLAQIAEALRGLDGLSWSLTKSIYSVANLILKYAHERYGSPFHRFSPARQHSAAKPIEVFTRAEQTHFLKELYENLNNEDSHYGLGILVCLYTGLRLGEICALKWEDIDMDGGLLYVKRTVQRIKTDDLDAKTILREDEPKSATSKREIPLPDAVMDLLQDFRGNGEYVVCGNRPAEPRTMYNHYQKHLRHTCIARKKFHCLRHTFATNCINAGVDVKSLSEILGHADVTITLNRYVHPSIDTKRRHLNTLSAIYGQYMGQKNLRIA